MACTTEGTFQAHALGLDVDGSGNIYLAGTFSGSLDWDGNVVSSAGLCGYVARLNSTGRCQWLRRIRGGGQSGGRAILAGDSGWVYLTGWFDDSIEIGESTSRNEKSLQSNGHRDIFLCRLSSESGTTHWARQIGNSLIDTGRDIAFAPSGTVALLGQGEAPGVGPYPFYYGLLAEFSADGQSLRERYLITKQSDSDFTRGLAIDRDGNYLIAGWTQDSFDENGNRLPPPKKMRVHGVRRGRFNGSVIQLSTDW